MFHMLSCFNLQPGASIDDFSDAAAEFAAHMQAEDLVDSVGPIGRRQTDTIMDTDDERDHEFFFIMSFRDREQCDRAVETIYPHEMPSDSLHKSVYKGIQDQVFICWGDI